MTVPTPELKPEEIQKFCNAVEVCKNASLRGYPKHDSEAWEAATVINCYLFAVRALLESRAEPRPVVGDWNTWIVNNRNLTHEPGYEPLYWIDEADLLDRLAAQEPSVPVSALRELCQKCFARGWSEVPIIDLGKLIAEATK